MADIPDAKQSLKEERKAIKDYGDRKARASDPELKGVFRHNRNEEKQHAGKLKRYIKGRSGGR